MGAFVPMETLAKTTYSTALSKSLSNIKTNSKKAGYGYEWNIITLKRGNGGSKTVYNTYIKNLKSYIKKNKGLGQNAYCTDYARVILTLGALGENPKNFAGRNLVKAMVNAPTTGFNSYVWTLMALNNVEGNITKDLSVEDKAKELIAEILSHELSSGGFNYSGDEADTDMTAMVITALSPYRESNQDVAKAIDRALSLLSESQLSDGSYSSHGQVTCESTAWVLIAITSLSIDPKTDERFIKEGNDLLAALMSFYISKGNFSHIRGKGKNALATTQATYALVAYKRFVNNKKPLFYY